MVGGHITIAINEQEYHKGLEEFSYSLIARLVFSKRDAPLTTKALKSNLSLLWLIPESAWILTPLGKGFYNLDLKNINAQSQVFYRGTLYLKPGVFRISRWSPKLNSST